MSGASFQELFLLMIIGLVILGPKRLPQVANQIGSWLGQARRMTRMMKRQLEDELNFDINSLNVQKQLGLDQTSSTDSTPSVSRPQFVQDQAKAAPADAEPADEEVEELPDDYSPAHAADDVGTGVGDDDEYLSTDEPDELDEPEPVLAAERDDAAEGTEEPVADQTKTA